MLSIFIVEIIVESVNLIQISKYKVIITMMENNYFFIKKVHIKTQTKKKDVLVIFILLQETKNSNLFDKDCTQENVKCCEERRKLT